MNEIDNPELHELCQTIIRYLVNNDSQNFLNNQNITNTLSEILPIINKKYLVTTKRRNRKLIPLSEMCMGRKGDGKQCTRRKINSTDYCKSHIRKLPNGRIDQEFSNNKVKAKRGRKRKVEFDPRQIDPNYITMWEDIIDGDRKLVDVNGNVYSYDLKNPVHIGKKTLESTLQVQSQVQVCA